MFRPLSNSAKSMHLRVVIFACATVLMLHNLPALGSAQDRQKTALIVYSLGHMYPVMATWDRTIWSVFRAQHDVNVTVYTENLDLTRYHDGEYIQKTIDSLRFRYAESEPDLIIAVFEPAVDFVLAHRQTLFADVPIVFGGIERPPGETVDLARDTTGVFQDSSAYGKTLELALTLHPGTRQVVIIGGAGFVEQSWLAQGRKTFAGYEDRVQFTYMVGLSLADIQKRVATIAPDSVVLSFPITEDSTGKSIISRDAISQIAKISKAPVYSFYPGPMSKGVVGGYIKDFSQQAKTTAEMGLAVLRGTPVEDIPPVQNNDLRYIFDWRQLKRFSIAADRLPPGSIVKFQELTIWDRYKIQIIGGLVVIVLQGIIILYLLYQRRVRLRAEQRVLAAELKYRTVADHTFDWEYWQKPDGSLPYVSPSCERISGYRAEDFMKMPSLLQQIIVNEDKKIWTDHRCTTRDEPKSAEIQFRIHRQDGEIRWIEHVCQPVFDAQGNNHGVRASNRDVSQREFYKSETRQLQSELAHMDRVVTISALSSALAHEINQPLAAMRSYGQAALRFLAQDPPHYQSIERSLHGIVRLNKRAAAVVKRLRDLVRKGEVHQERLEMNALIDEVISLINSEIVQRELLVSQDLDPNELPFHGDSIQIQQVMLNLLTNAWDAIADQPVPKRIITVSTRAENSKTIIVSVADSGGGIPAERREDVFAPFYTTKPKGVGLGLAICKSIIQSHGGTIWAADNPEGGTIFSFALPTGNQINQQQP